jgi:hypothetical protein
MWDSLTKLRQDIKNNLALKLNSSDTLTIMWFSGKGQYGEVLFNYNVETIKDINEVNNALERWLQPVGATCFEEVLASLATRIDDLPEDENKVFFLTDGYDNQSSKDNILKACEALSNKVDEFNIIEYGHYCNTSLLESMNAAVNGNHHFTESYDGVSKFFDSSQSTKSLKYDLGDGESLCYLLNGELYKAKSSFYPEGSQPLVYSDSFNTGVSNYLRMYFSDDIY